MTSRRLASHAFRAVAAALLLAALAAPQAQGLGLDRTFGHGGRMIVGFGSQHTDWSPDGLEAIDRAPDGDLVIAGGISGGFSVTRWLPSGRPERRFGGDGQVQTIF